MAQSYLDHPAFGFDTSAWDLPADPMNAFNEGYRAACRFGSSLDRTSRESLGRGLHGALDAVFSALRVQAGDENERLFLRELGAACARLLDEELRWHARERRASFVHLPTEEAQRDAVRMQLQRHLFGCLSRTAVATIHGIAENDLVSLRANAVAGRLRREDLSISSGSTVRAILAVVNREFRALGVLDVVSAYTGRRIRVTGLALELSVPQATWWRNAIPGLERPPHTLYAHLDETLSCPKSIVYLTDVGEANGPTGCYPGAYEAMQLNPLQELVGRVVGTVGTQAGSPLRDYYAKQYHQSVNSENFRRHFMRLPESLRFNSHMGWDVAPGSTLETELASTEHRLTGPAGTFIVFDGARLLHRGGLMQSGERVALQIIFSDQTSVERVISRARRMVS
jgi:hypothetical protein